MKLNSLGFETKLLTWIEAFLRHREQRVILNNEASEWSFVDRGVPQGSVFGPTLFLCYINDLPHNINHELKLFADDVKLFAKVDNALNDESLQNDLNAISEWSHK